MTLGLKYNGPYSLRVVENGRKIWSFIVPMKKMGLMKFKVNVTNAMSQVVFTKSIAVASSLDCAPPKLDIANRTENFYAPTEYKKTDMVVIESTTVLLCGSNQNHIKRWYIYEIDPVTVEVLREIELIDNPTVDYGQLVLQPGELPYGLYKFVFHVEMDIEIFQTDLEHFVKIIPSGIVVFSLKGGNF